METVRVARHGGTPWIQTFYSTSQLTLANGRAPERVAVRQLSEGLDRIGIDHEIHYDFPPVDVPSQYPLCSAPSTVDFRAPGGYVDVGRGTISDPPSVPTDPEPVSGHALPHFVDYVNLDAPVVAADSNMLLTDYIGGGCAYVGGNIGVAGAENLDVDPGFWVENGQDLWTDNASAILHEIGHNMGFTHGDAPGVAWETVDAEFHFTPTAPIEEPSNMCGETLAPDIHDTRIKELWYADCVAEHIEIASKEPFIECVGDGDCPSGQICENGECVDDGSNGNGGTDPEPAVARFDVTVNDLHAEVDASLSSGGGGIVNYSWNWGDGAGAFGVTAAHDYAQAGNYSIALTVTGSNGTTDTTAQTISVTEPPGNGNGDNGNGNGGCSSDGDCPSGQICDNGTCVDDGSNGNGGEVDRGRGILLAGGGLVALAFVLGKPEEP